MLLPYLGLFRPAQRALSWSRSLKVINELAAMVALGHVQVQGKAARPCPPRIWAQAMEQMAARSDLQRPMKNHNYLRQIVWQLADQADAGRERSQHQQVLTGNARANRDSQPPAAHPQADDGLSQIERQYLERHGHLPGMETTQPIRSLDDLAAMVRKKCTPPESSEEE